MWKSNVLFISAIFALCESAAILDKVNLKCSLSDSECLQRLYRGIVQDIADNGIPEMDVPKLDPFVIKNMDINALGMLKITMNDGTVKGFKSCNSKTFTNDVENRRTKIELICDVIAIEGQYTIESTPTLLALAGGINVHGNGNGGIVIEKVKLDLDFAFEINKKDDGEIHFHIDPEESTFEFEVLGKAAFSADNIFIGKQEISTVAVNILNENWDFVSKTFGKSIVEKALGLFYAHANKFLDIVPAKDLVTDDLTA